MWQNCSARETIACTDAAVYSFVGVCACGSERPSLGVYLPLVGLVHVRHDHGYSYHFYGGGCHDDADSTFFRVISRGKV